MATITRLSTPSAATVASHSLLISEPLVSTATTSPEAAPSGVGSSQVRPVLRFVEKPDRAAAEQYSTSGNHFWNGGIFLFRADTLIDELTRYSPEIASACGAAMAKASRDGQFLRPDRQTFNESPSISMNRPESPSTFFRPKDFVPDLPGCFLTSTSHVRLRGGVNAGRAP